MYICYGFPIVTDTLHRTLKHDLNLMRSIFYKFID
jgi:hypothetical protein